MFWLFSFLPQQGFSKRRKPAIVFTWLLLICNSMNWTRHGFVRRFIARRSTLCSASTYYLALDYRQGRTEQALEGFGQNCRPSEYERIVPFISCSFISIRAKQRNARDCRETSAGRSNESERIELYRLSAAGYYELNDHALSQEYYGHLRYNRSFCVRTLPHCINHYVAKEYEQRRSISCK